MSESTVNPKKNHQTMLIQAPLERVWNALTNSTELQNWFAEHIDVDIRVGGKYAFYGRDIPWGVAAESATGVIFELQDRKSIGWSWRFKDMNTTFGIEVEAKGGGTEARLSHEMPENEADYGYWIARDYSEVYLHNLKSYCETGEAACRPDYRNDRDVAVVSAEIAAPPEAVFAALTEPSVMSKWLSPKSKVDLRVGGEYTFGWTHEKDGVPEPAGPRMILEVEPNRKLTYDWFYGDEPPTQATWTIETASGGKTRLTVTHSGFGPTCDVTDYISGWSSYLCQGKALLEGSAEATKEALPAG